MVTGDSSFVTRSVLGIEDFSFFTRFSAPLLKSQRIQENTATEDTEATEIINT